MKSTRAPGTGRLIIGLVLLLVLAVALIGCGGTGTASSDAGTAVSPSESGEVRPLMVFAAAGLKNAFTELGAAFDRAHNAKTTFNFAAAGQLQKQIEGGAPADVFASADPKQMNALIEAGLADASSVKTFASNEIVLIVPAGSALGITCFQDLAKAGVEKVATGDPKVTPLGVATLEILPKLDMLDSVQPKLIYTQTVGQTLDYVARDEVDAGIVWSSEAQAGGDAVNTVATADPSWHSDVAFVIGLVSGSETKDLGRSFVDFVLSTEGQAFLRKHGFLEPPEGK